MPIGWLNPICLWLYMNQIENGATIFCRPSQSWALDFAKFFTCVRSRWLAVLVWPAPLYWYSNMNPSCQTMPKQNFRCRIPLNSSMTFPSGTRTLPTKVGPPWRHRCRSCCSSKDPKRWGRWGWGRDRNHDQNNSWVSNMLWHADVSSLFWLMAVKVDGRSRTQNQEKNHELVVQPMGTVCNMSGNWKPVSAFSNMIADRRQCQPNASPEVIQTHWDTLRHSSQCKESRSI